MIFLILLGTLVSCGIYITNKEISTREFLTMTLALCLTTLIVYGIAAIPFSNDRYFISGRLSSTIYHPYFVEQYEQAHTRCTTVGKTTSCYTYYTTEYAKHYPYWSVHDTLGRDWKISESFHNIIKKDFGENLITTKPNKCTHGGHFYKGDPYLYTYKNETNTYNYPTNNIMSWHNPLKGKNSIFNNKTDYKNEYPVAYDIYSTERLKTNETNITTKQWDILNTKIYEVVKANAILVKVANEKESKKLEDLWTKGKLNDVIITFVGNYKQPDFVKVFGWTKSAIVNYKLESFLLENGIQQSSLKGIEHIIKSYYMPFNMKDFNYITTPPSLVTFIVALIFCIMVGGICTYAFTNNYERK